MDKPTLAYVGIGGNLGQAEQTVQEALQALARLEASTLISQSSLYRTAPIEASGDDYINAVALISTTLSPHRLLTALQDIEQAHGRTRPYRNAPRTLDLDILLYGDLCIDDARLTVPHPRLTQRAFALVPLLEIAPQIQLPGIGLAHTFLPAVADQAIDKLAR